MLLVKLTLRDVSAIYAEPCRFLASDNCAPRQSDTWFVTQFLLLLDTGSVSDYQTLH